VSTGLALAVFAIGLAVSLGASELLVRGFSRLGARLGLAAGLVGLLTALGADGPEISSAITALLSGARDVGLGVILGSNLFNLAALLGLSSVIAGRLGFRRILLVLDGGVAMWSTVVIGALLLGRLAPVLALVFVAAAFLLYVYWLVVQGSPGRRASSESWTPVWWIVPATAAIVGGSYAMVKGALVVGDEWHISRAFLGAVVLAAITSLPNAYAAVRFATQRNGTAVVSLAFNSNTLNLLAGISIPAVFIGGLSSAPGAAGGVAWLLAMTLLAIGLGYAQRGLSRVGGAVLIAVYLLFVAIRFH
jgi:cation:H+ antiporter